MSPTSPNKTQRLLDLIAVLVAHRFPIPRSQIWDRVAGYRMPLEGGTVEASVRRTFERDKKELLEMGFPLETVEVSGNDPDEQQLYRLSGRDFYLPYLRLIEEGGATPSSGAASGKDPGSGETPDPDGTRTPRQRPKPGDTPLSRLGPDTTFAAARSLRDLASNPDLPFQAEAASAFRKLTSDLEGDLDELFGPRPVLVPGDDVDTQALVPEIARAMRDRRVLRFTYHGIERDEPTRREVEPWSLLYKQSRWYLVGHDRSRADRRVFRVSRILELAPVTGGEPEFSAPDVDLGVWDDARAWDLPGMEEPATDVTLRFHFPRSLWAARNEIGKLIGHEADGASLRRFSVRSTGPFLRWVLGQLGEVEIVQPDALIGEAEALRQRVVDANPSLFRGGPE